MRIAKISRNTKETKISAEINLDGSGKYQVETGIGFLDHMIEQLSRHSLIDISLEVKGDTFIDAHHTCEDSAIALGQAFKEALADKKGIARFAHAYAPMDETLTRAVIDLSGRAYAVFDVDFTIDKLGELDTELIREWVYAFAFNLGANIHVTNLYGVNNHHKSESCFKALALSLKQAVKIDERMKSSIPSTKGVI